MNETVKTHTPLPWEIDPAYLSEVQTSQLQSISTCWHEQAVGQQITVTGILPCSLAESAANAALIVRAVNNHDDLLALAHQYASDLRHPPSAESVERRLERIAAVLAKVGV